MGKTFEELFKQVGYSKEDLQSIFYLCAEDESIKPLLGLAFLDNRALTEDEIEYGRKLAEAIKVKAG